MNTQKTLSASFLLLCAAAAGRAEFQVNTWTTRNQEKACVAMDATGNFVVVWRSQSGDGRGEGVFGQRFDALGNRAGGEFKINIRGGIQNEPSVAMDRAGNFVVAWDSEDGAILMRRYDSNGVALTGEIQVNTDGPTPTLPVYDPRYPNVDMNNAGAFVVVWRTFRGISLLSGDRQLDGRAFDSGGSPRGLEFRIAPSGVHFSGEVAIDNRGDFVATWLDSQLYFRMKMHRLNADGTPKGPAVEVNDVPFSPASEFSLAMDGSGRFVVAWTQSGDVYARRFEADGNRIGPEFVLGPGAGSRASNPSIAMLVDGQFLATWHRGEIGSRDVVGRWFSSHGSPRSGEFRINTHTTGDQGFPDAAMNDTGEHVVVVWQSDGQDGSDYGVFGEIGLALPASSRRWDTYR